MNLKTIFRSGAAWLRQKCRREGPLTAYMRAVNSKGGAAPDSKAFGGRREHELRRNILRKTEHDPNLKTKP